MAWFMVIVLKDSRNLALNWQFHEDCSSDLYFARPNLNQPLKYYLGWRDERHFYKPKSFGTVDKALTFIPAVTLIKSLFLDSWIPALTLARLGTSPFKRRKKWKLKSELLITNLIKKLRSMFSWQSLLATEPRICSTQWEKTKENPFNKLRLKLLFFTSKFSSY